jgi:chromosome segregation ATPase
MSAGKASEVTAEKGFGTGLSGAVAETFLQRELQSVNSAVVARLRAELEASFAREQTLQNALAKLGPKSARGSGATSAEHRSIKNSLKERERELAHEREQMAEERAALGGLESEMAQVKARSDELERQIEANAKLLERAGDDRKRLERELRVREASTAAGDKESAARERTLERRVRALEIEIARLSERDEALETHGIELAAQERALALAIDQLAERSDALRDLEALLNNRSEELDGREVTLQANIERIGKATGSDLERLTELSATLEQRTRELDERERELEGTDKVIEERLRKLDRKERRVEHVEAGYLDRVARLEPRLDQRDRFSEETEKRIAQNEDDLQSWVGQPQSDLGEREGDWWAKQLGQRAEEKAPKERVSGGLRAIK